MSRVRAEGGWGAPAAVDPHHQLLATVVGTLLVAGFLACSPSEKPSPQQGSTDGPAPRSVAPEPDETSPSAGASGPLALTYGVAVTRSLTAGECIDYQLGPPSGRWVRVEVQQHWVDAYVDLIVQSSKGGTRPVARVDGWTEDLGPEGAVVLLDETSTLTARLCAYSGTGPGDARLRIDALTAITPAVRAGAQAYADYRRGARLVSKARGLRGAAATLPMQESGRAFTQALGRYRLAEDLRGQAWCTFRLARHAEWENDPSSAIERYRRAFDLYGALEDRDDQARIAIQLSRVLKEESLDSQEALEFAELADAIAEKVGHRDLVDTARLSQGVILGDRGEVGPAVTLLRELSDTSRSVEPTTRWEALRALSNLYRDHGEPGPALDLSRRALALARSVNMDRVAESLEEIGRNWRSLEELEEALEHFEQAVEIYRQRGSRGEEAGALNNVGRLLRLLGQTERAEEVLEQALDLARAEGRSGVESTALINLGLTRYPTKPRQALAHCSRGLELQQRKGREVIVVAARSCLARAHLALGEPHEALEQAAEAAEVLEQVRERADILELRQGFLAAYREPWELQLVALSRLHRENPGGPWAERAFEVAERSRARVFLDLLADSLTRLNRVGAETWVQEENELQDQLYEERQRMARSPDDSPAALQAAQRSRQITEMLRQMRARRWSIPEGEPLNLAAIRESVLDAETRLLAFFLGDEGSYAWVIDQEGSVEFIELELDLRRLGRQIRQSAELLGTPGETLEGGRLGTSLDRLAEQVLGPVAEALLAPGPTGRRPERLALVTDGELQRLPFAVLPLAGEGRGLLVDRFELVSLPSASVLGLVRNRSRERTDDGGPWAVAVVDPVFDPTDGRLSAVEARQTAANEAQGLESLHRLSGTALEAEALAALLPGRLAVRSGFDATKAWVRQGGLGSYRLIHLATHAELAPEPRILLSRFEPDGSLSEQDGALGLHEIYLLDLQADLVVLSACRTGLGDLVPGEGMVGLSRAFFYAGTPRLLVSMWDVEDEATQVLMERYYHHLLGGELAPAAALAEAQRDLRAEYSPSVWAAFTFQGDWRPIPGLSTSASTATAPSSTPTP